MFIYLFIYLSRATAQTRYYQTFGLNVDQIIFPWKQQYCIDRAQKFRFLYVAPTSKRKYEVILSQEDGQYACKFI